MRLLLTSSGITNSSLNEAFVQLLGKDVSKTNVAFIPTGANVYTDTSWLKVDIFNLKRTGVSAIELVDISKLDRSQSLQKLIAADVIWLNGGNTYYLLEWLRRTELAKELTNLLRDRLYVGVSAGSMITGPSVESNSAMFPEEDEHKIEDLTGLNLVPFAVIPHLSSASFPHSTADIIEKFATQVPYPIYALDDASAVEVIDGRLKIVSEGKTISYNTKA